MPTQPETPSAGATPLHFRRRRRWLGLGLGLFATLLVLAFLRLNPGFHPAEAVQFLREAGPWAYFSAMGLLPVIGFPLAPFNLAAGPAFVPSLGLLPVILLACAAIGVNVSLTYLLSKYTLRPLVMRAAAWLGYSIPEIPADKYLAAAFLVRATPGPPFFLQSCLLGIAGVPFLPYMIASLSVAGVYAALVIAGGDALMNGQMRIVLLCCAGLGLFATVLRLLRRKGRSSKR